MPRLKGRIALVTGSSRGIGAAIAGQFARHGAHVVLHGRDPDALDAQRAAIEWEGAKALVATGDVTSESEVEAMRDFIERSVGAPDIVVTNAGGSVGPRPLEDLSLADWRTEIDANLTSAFLTIRAFLPAMKRAGRGSIITISSAAARRSHPRSPIAYAAAKAGVQMLTQHLATQIGPSGIRVNCIAPETIMTERNEEQIPAEIRRSLIDAHPLRRLGTPEDVAEAALFLVSDQAAWITGQIIDVAGGAVMA